MKGMLIDETGELVVRQKRMTIGDSDSQTIEIILRANRGELKEFPLVGGEVVKRLSGKPNHMWCALMEQQIRQCGIPVRSVTMNNNEIRATI